MKKLIVTTIVLGAIATSAFSQGLVNFSAGGNASTRISTNSAVGGPATGSTFATANSYYFALFASSSQTSVNGQSGAVTGQPGSYVFNFLGNGTPSTGWELVGIGANIASAGRMIGISQGTSSAAQGAINADNSLTVQGIAGAASANFVVVGWSANIGSTLAALEAWYANPTFTAWLGQSAVATGLPLGDGVNTSTPNPFGIAAGQIPGFTLGEVIVPEPGTLALAALGGASLLLFRRKK